MSEGREPKLRLPPVEEISIVVKDMDATMEFFSSVFG
jgi:predicted enzyme related to lactoylglutathione lyase